MGRGKILALAVVVTGALVTGCGGGGSCGEPTVEQCTDQTWLETTECGQAALEVMRTKDDATCNTLIAKNAAELTADIEPESVAVPDELGGGSAAAKVVPNPESRPSDISMPLTLTGSANQSAAGATAAGLSAAEQALRTQWNANGSKVGSCREYVFEKYYDYSLFEDAVAARRDSFPYVAGLAFAAPGATALGTRGAGGDTLKMKDGTEMTVQAPREGYVVDVSPDGGDCYGSWTTIILTNPFFAMPKELAPDRWATLRNLRCYHPDITTSSYVPPSPQSRWQRHKAALDAVVTAGLPLVELDTMYANVQEFQRLLQAYRAYQTAGTPACCSTEPSGDCCTENQATGASLKQRLQDLFALADTAGCLGGGTTRCDWSPNFFVASLRDMFGKAMEDDYQHCLELTGDDFAALKAYQFPTLPAPCSRAWPSPDECGMSFPEWTTCPVDDYTASANAVDSFFSRHDQYKAAKIACLVAGLPKDLLDAAGNPRLPGQKIDERHEAGNSKFGAFYEYHLDYHLNGLDPSQSPTPQQICMATPVASGSFSAGGQLFGSGQINAIDAKVEADVDKVVGHLLVLDEEIWSVNLSELATNSTFSVSRDIVMPRPGERPKDDDDHHGLVAPFSIVGIPMSVEIGAAGSLGLTPIYDGTKASSYQPGQNCWSLTAGFEPALGLEVFAALNALDLGMAKAGISVSFTLLELKLPVTWTLTQRSDTTTTPGTEHIVLENKSGAELRAEMLAGKVSAFVKVEVLGFGGTYSYKIIGWDGIKFPGWSLWTSDYKVNLDDLVFVMGG